MTMIAVIVSASHWLHQWNLPFKSLDSFPGRLLAITQPFDPELFNFFQDADRAGVRVGGADGPELAGAGGSPAAFAVVGIAAGASSKDGLLDRVHKLRLGVEDESVSSGTRSTRDKGAHIQRCVMYEQFMGVRCDLTATRCQMLKLKVVMFRLQRRAVW